MNPRIIRRLAAVLVAAIGVMNIVSAVHPAVHARLEILKDLVSLDIIRGSHTATVLAGFFLILLADGLRTRRKRALHLTVLLLILSTVLNLTKGLDFEESILTGALAAWLLYVREVFNIECRALTPYRIGEHLSEAFVLYWGYVFLGFFLLRHAVRPAPTLFDVLAEPFRLVAGMPNFVYLTGQARWFENSLTVVACLFVIYGVALALRPFVPLTRPTTHDMDRARELVQRFGTDTLSYFALQDGRSYFFHPSVEAFLSYRLWGNVALVGGDPIGKPEHIPELVEQFLDYAEANGVQPCFLGVSAESQGMYHRAGLRMLKIGEEALIDLPSFDRSTLKRKVRRAVRHTEELGIRVMTYGADGVPEPIAAQMRAINDAWMNIKGGAERGFSMTLGRFPRSDDRDCEITVALQGDTVLGFLSVVPVCSTKSWSLDAMRRLPDSPNGLMEFLVIRLAEQYRQRGFQTLSLNFASLANSMNDIDSRMLEETRRFIFENLSGFYQLKSLAQFNNKFAPEWRSRYLAYGDVLTFPKLVLAVVQAEDPIKVPRLMAGRR